MRLTQTGPTRFSSTGIQRVSRETQTSCAPTATGLAVSRETAILLVGPTDDRLQANAGNGQHTPFHIPAPTPAPPITGRPVSRETSELVPTAGGVGYHQSPPLRAHAIIPSLVKRTELSRQVPDGKLHDGRNDHTGDQLGEFRPANPSPKTQRTAWRFTYLFHVKRAIEQVLLSSSRTLSFP